MHIAGQKNNVCKRYGVMENHEPMSVIILDFHLRYSSKSTLETQLLIQMFLFTVFLMSLYAPRNSLKHYWYIFVLETSLLPNFFFFLSVFVRKNNSEVGTDGSILSIKRLIHLGRVGGKKSTDFDIQ